MKHSTLWLLALLFINVSLNAQPWEQVGTSLDGEPGDQFGIALSINEDGSTLALGVPRFSGGFVKIFDRIGADWVQRGQDISDGGQYFGKDISLTADGNTIVIGSTDETSGPGRAVVYRWNGNVWVGISSNLNGDVNEDYAGNSVDITPDGNTVVVGSGNAISLGNYEGTIKVYRWNEQSQNYEQLGSNIYGTEAGQLFGLAVAISADGNTIIGGNTYSEVYNWNGSSWVQKGARINEALPFDATGISVDISADANTILVGSPGFNTNPDSEGLARAFIWNGNSWVQKGNNIVGEAVNDNSGIQVRMSADGDIVAIAATQNDPNNLSNAGHVRVYEWNGFAWIQKGSDIDGTYEEGFFGRGLALTPDGNTIAIGAPTVAFSPNLFNNGQVKVFSSCDLDADVTISDFGVTLSVMQDAESIYQWYDCSGSSPVVIDGATSSSFTATQNGAYNVEVSKGSCFKFSDCTSVTQVSISENEMLADLNIYPNPNNGEFLVDVPVDYQEIRLRVFNVHGALVSTQISSQENKTPFTIAAPEGIYFLEIIVNGKHRTSRKIIKTN